MKKLIVVLVALCLVAAVAFGAVSMRGAVPGTWETAAQTSAPETEKDPTEGWVMDEIGPLSEEEAAAAVGTTTGALPAAPEAASATATGRVDFEALYALHAPDEKVLAINGQEETWGDYFYGLYAQGMQIENYFDSMALYEGSRHAWDDPIEEGGERTFADALVESAGDFLKQMTAMERFAQDNGVEVSEEMRAIIDAQKQQDMVSLLGEEATPEEFFKLLEEQYLSPEMYERSVKYNILYQECFTRLYGEKAENLSEEAALNYLTENNYRAAGHILFLFNDPASGEVRDEETRAAKKAELETLRDELRGIEDEGLRAKTFLEKTAELSEDSGKSYYPDGYTYTPGTMVPQFEEAVDALAEYEISDVVETEYGYHLIIRLPLNADAAVEFSNNTGEARTARMLAANQEYGERLQGVFDELELEWLPGAGAPALMEYVR